jgi:hypothetical protein
MKKQLITKLMFAGMVASGLTKAQEVTALSDVDSLKYKMDQVQTDLKKLNQIKISGYIQAQYQVADSVGAKSFAGGDFGSGLDKRFMLRRGRVKFTYTGNLTQYVLQLDATEKGVGIKDAYVKLTEPALQTFSLTAGIFDRPFGFEIGYSSSQRETPERGRMSQTLFPGERDLGAMVSFEPPKTSKFNFIKIDAGLFNGTGIALTNTSDFDKQKDFIGRINLKKSISDEKIKISGGGSYYNGGSAQQTKKVYNTNTLPTGTLAFTVDSASTNKGLIAKREYYGVDAQVSIDWIAGLTTLRGEYIQGTQPGGSSSSKTAQAAGDVTDTYIRSFNGAYFYFLQNIGQTKHQLIAKYDWYDPNIKVKGTDIGATGATGLGTADLKYTTIGLGWVYRYDLNIKFTAYYDMVKNENTLKTGYTKDLKDNVFTLRVQYKF